MRRAFTLTLLMLMMAMTPMMTGSAQGTGDSVIINEILISPNNENYDGTDWNGDGSMGTHNDQFLELYNPTPDAIDLGGWWLDDIADGGSPACSIGWGTVLEAGAYIAFYRSWTGIEFDFWDGDTIRILDSSGVEVDSVSYGAEDSDWDVPYGYDSGGNWVKLSDGSPTPGGANDQEWGGANHLQGNC
ncbi:MAG: lamin tail domain-containing protein, partial [Candidatus Thalassarchaeum sp.]|nr:lamin tail domain-containing protein [Candidatus Thalassarchaeum sp.]